MLYVYIVLDSRNFFYLLLRQCAFFSGQSQALTSVYNLQQLASHGLFDVYVKATGDTHIDDHHSNEDIALAIGTVIVAFLSYY